MSGQVAAVAPGKPETWTPMLEQSAREVFELMLACKLSLANATLQETPELTSMVGLAGRLCGLLSIRCSQKAAELMASKMLGIDADNVTDEVMDAFGEVGNMVAGNFKNKIPGLGDGCMLSVPTVVTGKDYTLHSASKEPAIQLNLLFEGLLVVVTLQISE